MTERERKRLLDMVVTGYEDPPATLAAIESSVHRDVIAKLREVFELAARADQRRFEDVSRRLGLELLPLHGRLL